MKPLTPHHCPHCRCTWHTSDVMGYVNRDAPFYPLVELIDRLTVAHIVEGRLAMSTPRPQATATPRRQKPRSSAGDPQDETERVA